MKTFYTWSAAVKELGERIAVMRPLAGRGVGIEQTPGGMRISVLEEHQYNYDYCGSFKLIIDEDVINVVDGMGVDPDNAGFAQINGRTYQVADQTCAVPSSSGYVCLKGELDQTGEIATFSVEIKESPMRDFDNEAVYPLGYVKITGEGENLSASLIQFYHAMPQLWVTGDCNNEVT
jgi:hypothetical protein